MYKMTERLWQNKLVVSKNEKVVLTVKRKMPKEIML